MQPSCGSDAPSKLRLQIKNAFLQNSVNFMQVLKIVIKNYAVRLSVSANEGH